MPRIRKKTSKRVSLHHRERIKGKVKETRRKKGKEAKKNPQWKSKHPKDPGIPSAFPYKDQILAEVAEQRRLVAEGKQRKKEERKAAKAGSAVAEAEEEKEEEEEGGGAFDGVQALSAGRARSGPSEEERDMVEEDEEEEEEEVPILVNPDLPNLKAVLDAADVVVEVLDARDPMASRSAHLEEVAQGLGKRVLLVLNKVDACPREAVEAWAATLRREHPTVLFRSATACLPVLAQDAEKGGNKGKGRHSERADDAWGLDSVTTLLHEWAAEKGGDRPLTVAVVGVTNVGKSSLANSLLRKAALQTYKLTSTTSDSPTTTTHPQEVTVDIQDGKQIRIIDTPGILWHPTEDASPEETAQLRARDILLRSRGHIERLKDPSSVLSEIVSRATREDLMLLYNLPIFSSGDSNAFLAGVARANAFTKRKGQLDLAGAARMVLRDWSNGKLARFTVPAPAHNSQDAPMIDDALAAIYTQDDAVLSKLSTRKELRRAGGVVLLRTGATVDTRKVVLDASYFVSSEDEGNEGDEEDGAALDDVDEVGLVDEPSEGDYVSDEDEEESHDEEGDEDEEEEATSSSPPPHRKRKRVVSEAAPRPTKRVAFAAEPKGTKQARSAAGAKGSLNSGSKPSGDQPGPGRGGRTKPPKAAPPKAIKSRHGSGAAKKIANSAPSTSKKGAAISAKDREVAYDFKQFF